MFEQLLKPHSLPRVDSRRERDIEQQTVIVRTPRRETPRSIGPRTKDPSLPYGVTPNQAAALDAVILHGTDSAAARCLGIVADSVSERVRLASKKIPGPHRLAKLIAWARARNLLIEGGE